MPWVWAFVKKTTILGKGKVWNHLTQYQKKSIVICRFIAFGKFLQQNVCISCITQNGTTRLKDSWSSDIAKLLAKIMWTSILISFSYVVLSTERETINGGIIRRIRMELLLHLTYTHYWQPINQSLFVQLNIRKNPELITYLKKWRAGLFLNVWC